MRVLFCSSEIYPYVKTGGLGDVTAALPKALAKAGVDVRLFLPGYSSILDHLQDVVTLCTFPVYFGAADVRLLKGVLPEGLRAYVLDAPGFWDRSSAYVDEAGQDWADNHYRFAAFCRAASDIHEYDPSWQPDIVHGNDWQCGLIPPYLKLKGGRQAKSVMTIHNIAYQGLFPAAILPAIGIPGSMFTLDGAEFYGKAGYLKAGLAYSDRITTVSPTYAEEIMKSEQGCGLQDFLKTKSDILSGIVNGIDTDIWDPKADASILYPYDAGRLEKRAKNRDALIESFGLKPLRDKPVFAVISRLGYQKGLDILLQSMPRLLELGGSLILLGTGDKDLEGAFAQLQKDHPGRVSVRIGYDETQAHRILAGTDIVLMPSRSEPCGLVQLYAMRYGAVPFVRRTGGLADTVLDKGKNPTGFLFDDETAVSFQEKLPGIFDAYRDRAGWRALQENGMQRKSGWDISASDYMELYNHLIGKA